MILLDITLFGWLVIVGVAAMVFLFVGMIWSERRKRRGFRRRRGVEPGQGHTLLHTSMGSSHSNGAGHASRSWTVTKDPQAYARSFVPRDRE